MSIDVTITGGTAPEVTVGDAGASVSVPSVTGVLSLNSLSGAVTLAVVGGTIATAGNTLTITVTGGGASSWADLTGKPFTTLGTGLSVSGAGVLSATGLAIADTTGLQAALDAKAPIASPTFTGTVSGVTKAMVGLGSADNTADASKPVSTLQAAADAAVQAHAVQRSNHTGTQAVGTITGLGTLATQSALGNITSVGAVGTVAGRILTTDADGVVGTSGVGDGLVLEGDSIQADVPYIKTQLATVVVTLASLTADVNDWVIGTGDFFRVAGTAARNVTGIAAGTSGQPILLVNVGSFALTLRHASTSSSAANRFTTPWAGDCILAANGGNAVLVYDSTSSAWRVL